jgi:ectoine hydroxylase-related dioxygenase (phytanoyl-CoA dioxygenase family)
MLNSYGVRESTVVHNEAERHAEEIRIFGYSIVPGLLTPDRLPSVRQALDRLYQSQAEAIGGEEFLRKIQDTNVVRCPLVEDRLFLELATHPRLLAVIQALLGDYFILNQQNGVINPPNREFTQAAWHRDLAYQHFVVSRPLAISALWCLDDFNEVTGGTSVLPASHHTEPFPSAEYIAAHEKTIVAGAGDALVFDSMVFHRAGHNRSPGVRRGLNHMYSLPFLKQQISFPQALNGRYRDDPFLAKFLGYESEPGESALEWRRRRLARLSSAGQPSQGSPGAVGKS